VRPFERDPARSIERPFPDRECAISDRGSARGKSDFSGDDPRLSAEYAQGAIVANCHEQLFSPGGLVLHRDTYFVVLWDLAAGGAGGRRDGGYFDGLVALEAGPWRRSKQVEEAQYSDRRSIPQCVLPADLAADGRAGIDFRGDYAGRKCSTPPGIQSGEYCGGDRGGVSIGAEHLLVLWILGSIGTDTGPHGNDRYYAAHFLSAGVYRRADSMERSKHAFGNTRYPRALVWIKRVPAISSLGSSWAIRLD
jgi:hypothetical protein